MDLKTVTQRLTWTAGTLKPLVSSCNCGLESYLTEAYCNRGGASTEKSRVVADSIRRIGGQAVQFDEKTIVWGWEKVPTFNGVKFPPDWDDTSKAIDAIRAALDLSSATSCLLLADSLPSNQLWETTLLDSIFTSNLIGEEITFQVEQAPALSVFFGPGSSEIPRRDDPMVTVVTVRSTCLHYPLVLNRIRDALIELMIRPSIVFQRCLELKEPFEGYSRYYFSFGHFAYRFIEASLLLRKDLKSLGLDESLLNLRVSEAIRRRAAYSAASRHQQIEDLWWLLIGLRLRILDSNDAVALELAGSESEYLPVDNEDPEVPDIVFRHRRLGHYYGAPKWYYQLIGLEIQSIVSLRQDSEVDASYIDNSGSKQGRLHVPSA